MLHLENIDRKYINMLGSKLEKFKWKAQNIAVCRCFKCGDSKKHKNKCRGFFFCHQGKYFFKCHNCGYATDLSGVLENLDANLLKEYKFEIFKKPGEETYKITPTKTFHPEVTEASQSVVDGLLGVPCNYMAKTHYSVEYLLGRGIPEDRLNLFRHCSEFGKLLEFFGKSTFKEERLVIPFYENGSFIGCQARSYAETKDSIKYITLKTEGIHRLFYNLDNIDPAKDVYLTEGPIDSMFLPNAGSLQGMGNWQYLPEKIQDSNIIFVLDNEPRNVELVGILGKIIRRDHSIVIWPEDLVEKDVNKMVQVHGIEKTLKIIREGTSKGLQATLLLDRWKKCDTLD